MSRTLTIDEVREHNTSKSCWVIIRDKVYDVTDFLLEHPGGDAIILKYAGRDATRAYEPIHPRGMLEQHLPPSKHLGELSISDADKLKAEEDRIEKTADERRVARELKKRPPLSRMLSCRDIEDVARKVLSFRALSYYLSAGDDEITHRSNEEYWSKFFFIPRVLRPVSHCDPSTRILGFDSPLPFFVSAAALAKLGHPLGEVNITRGCGKCSLIQMVSTNASCSLEEMSEARLSPNQVQFFQFYKHKDDAASEQLLRRAEKLGYKAIFLTVDAVVAGNRERDIKSPWVEEEMQVQWDWENGKAIKREKENVDEAGSADAPEARVDEPYDDAKEEVGGMAGALLKTADLGMSWDKTIPWIRQRTKLPLVIKGIQSVQDAVLAAEAGVDGILISNHGGRQLNYSMPTIEVLYRLRQQHPDVFDKLEVFVDGGVRRGTDVLKALCLGAKAVGLGRPFLFAQSAYGEAGVVKLIRILEKEIVTGMRLLGATNVKELVPEMVEKVDFRVKL